MCLKVIPINPNVELRGGRLVAKKRKQKEEKEKKDIIDLIKETLLKTKSK